MIGMVLLGVMCFGATSLAIVPSAGLAFVAIVAAGQIRMALYHDSVAVTLLAITTPVVIGQSIMASARLFARQVQCRGELEEQGQLISLLREFQSSGANGYGNSMPTFASVIFPPAWPSRSGARRSS